jgi:hypothetical protein
LLLALIFTPILAAAVLLTEVLAGAVALHLLLVLFEVFGPHTNSHVAAAACFMRSGRPRAVFWGLFVGIGSLLPLLLLCLALLVPDLPLLVPALAGLAALIGLFAYEHCFVVAGQAVPLS